MKKTRCWAGWSSGLAIIILVMAGNMFSPPQNGVWGGEGCVRGDAERPAGLVAPQVLLLEVASISPLLLLDFTTCSDNRPPRHKAPTFDGGVLPCLSSPKHFRLVSLFSVIPFSFSQRFLSFRLTKASPSCFNFASVFPFFFFFMCIISKVSCRSRVGRTVCTQSTASTYQGSQAVIIT